MLNITFYRATLCWRGICCRRVPVRSSVRLSVRQSVKAGTVPKRPPNIGSRKQRHTIGHTCTWGQNTRRNFNGVTTTLAPNRGGVGSNWRFSINISLYLRNGARQRHSYYGTLIGTRKRSIEWCCFQWPWVTLTTANHPIFAILYRLSYLPSE